MRPQETSGGCIPRPRKLREDSSKIMRATSMKATVNSGVKTFGRMWTRMMRTFDAPIA